MEIFSSFSRRLKTTGKDLKSGRPKADSPVPVCNLTTHHISINMSTDSFIITKRDGSTEAFSVEK